MVAAGVPGLAQRTYSLGSAPTGASGFHLVVQLSFRTVERAPDSLLS